MHTGQITTVKGPGADTRDIMHALAAAVPAAVMQQQQFAQEYGSSDPIKDALTFARYIQNAVDYVPDSFLLQAIKLPDSLLALGKGDCKSISLFITAALVAAGHKAGFRFASYSKNKPFTHVYSIVYVDGKAIPVDGVVTSLNEQPYVKKQDMSVVYLHGVPTAIYADDTDTITGPRRDKRRAKRAQNKAEGKPTTFKKISLAPVRGAFLPLVALNFRGFATRLEKGLAKDKGKVSRFWVNLGGKPDKLIEAIKKGAKKKRILGFEEMANEVYYNGYMNDQGVIHGVCDLNEVCPYVGMPCNINGYIGVATVALISSAAAAIIAASKLLDSLGIQKDKDTAELEAEALATNPEPLGTDFVVSDPEPGVMPRTNELAREAGIIVPGSSSSFSASLPLLAAGAALLLLTLKPSK